MTAIYGVAKILRSFSELTDQLAADGDYPAIYAGQASGYASEIYPRVEVWTVAQDRRMIGTVTVQVSIYVNDANPGKAEAVIDDIASSIVDALDGYNGAVTAGSNGVAINACAYQPGGNSAILEGGVLFCPLTFAVQTNRI